MKVLRKKYLIRDNQIKYSLIEKRILEGNTGHPFLLSLHFAFQTVENLFMVIDYCPNEDLSRLVLKQTGNKFQENVAKVYIAELVLAIEELHRRKYIYRDLKPENILLDEVGHIKLGDFGLAAENINNPNQFARSFCGSPIYISPEILKYRKTYQCSDFYSMGVVLYELVTGEPPFYDDNIDCLYNKIKSGTFNFASNVNLSENTKNFIIKLMSGNTKNRIGYS